MPNLRILDIWQGMADLVRGRLGLFFAVAAPFTLLIDMSLRVFGPTPPATMAEFTTGTLFWLVILPGIIASLAQLSIAGLILRPGTVPRAAITAAFAVWPVYLAALMFSSVPSALGFLLLVLPGIYITGRLFLIVPLAVMRPKTDPIGLLRTSWRMTSEHGWTLMGFFVLAILGLFGLSIIAGGVGGALGSVLTLLGFAEAGRFAAGLVPAVASTFVAIGSATIASLLYKKLS